MTMKTGAGPKSAGERRRRHRNRCSGKAAHLLTLVNYSKPESTQCTPILLVKRILTPPPTPSSAPLPLLHLRSLALFGNVDGY